MTPIFLLLAAMGVFATVNNTAASDKTDGNALDQLEAHIQTYHSTSERSAIPLEDNYFKLAPRIFNEEQLQEASPTYLDRAFSAAHGVSFYLRDDTGLKAMERTLEAMESRDIDKDEHYTDLFQTYVLLRAFSKAEDLRKRPNAPELPDLPETEDPLGKNYDQPSHWVISSEGRTLRREPFTMPEESGIIMVAHPLCQFSNSAVSAMLSEPVIGDVIRENIQLVAPTNTHLAFDVLQSWNREEKLPKISLAHQIQGWDHFDFSGTPSIHFLDRGEIKGHIMGWPDDERIDKVEANLQRIGLLPSDQGSAD